jgi:hypothetical protein
MTARMPSENMGLGSYEGSYEYARGHQIGWVTFAGAMLVIMGLTNVIGGIAAIGDSKVYVADAEFVIGSLNTWGWVILATGVAQTFAGIGIFVRNQFARWLGVFFAAGNAFFQLVMIPAFPLWSIAVFASDILIVYGLLVYGSRDSTSD